MTSYSTERPTLRRSAGSGLVHLRPGQATIGQPVTIRTFDESGHEIEFQAVYIRTDGVHMRCQGVEDGQTRRYRPSQVFPRRETYRRWRVTFRQNGRTAGELHPVPVVARTEMEARYEALKRLKTGFGDRASLRFTFHSAKREG